ncbi:MAG: hypothetical protein KDC79_17390 [Cyclobacteriaceae bacterium]|nr:hypothetical protein [Cyclobacteriaceae bacterium]
MLGKFSVQIARAIDRYDIAHEFSIKHKRVLKSYGVDGISSAKARWKYLPNVYMIAVYDNISGEMIGGMRLEVSSQKYLLPFEAALGNTMPEVKKFVSTHRYSGGVCEFSGLWVDPKFRKMHIPEYMTKLGITLSGKLGIKYAFAFANNYSRPITEKLGFDVQSIDGQTVFLYPDERYPTQLMRKDCTTGLSDALVESEEFLKEHALDHIVPAR